MGSLVTVLLQIVSWFWQFEKVWKLVRITYKSYKNVPIFDPRCRLCQGRGGWRGGKLYSLIRPSCNGRRIGPDVAGGPALCGSTRSETVKALGFRQCIIELLHHPLEQPASWYSVNLLLDRFLPQTKEDTNYFLPTFCCCNYPHIM